MGILAITTDVPDCWSIRSVLSVFGVIYIIFSIFLILSQGGLKGGLTLVKFALVGACLVSISGPGENPDYLPELDGGLNLRVICEDPNGIFYWGDYVWEVRFDRHWRFNNKFNTFDDDDRGCYDPEPKIYAMHDPAFKGYISPKIFHPAAFFWSPFLMGIFGFVAGFLWNIFGILFFSSY